jgi:excisionase family DNA binding protein
MLPLRSSTMSAALSYAEPLQPTDVEIALAQKASRALSHLAGHDRAVRVEAVEGEGGHKETFVLPAAAVRLMLDMLGQMAAGHAVTVVPVHAELTTQQAAEVLGVSRPFLVGLLEQGKLPFRKVGTHRRVNYGEVLAYKRREHEARRQALDELACQGQEFGMGY